MSSPSGSEFFNVGSMNTRNAIAAGFIIGISRLTVAGIASPSSFASDRLSAIIADTLPLLNTNLMSILFFGWAVVIIMEIRLTCTPEDIAVFVKLIYNSITVRIPKMLRGAGNRI
jgi:hypothetical protein